MSGEAAAEWPTIKRPLRILVVEDDELDRRAVRRCLQQCGIAVVAEDAASADETLQRIGSVSYDCVLLDYYIPGVNGLALFQKIRDLEANMPVVIFTGRGDEDIAVELMKAGAADYLPKASLSAERLASSLRSQRGTVAGRGGASPRRRGATCPGGALSHLGQRDPAACLDG
jgi:DNA-binding NtrC family response regulator